MTSVRTVTLTGPEHLVAHIEGLQATIAKRNARITQLEAQLSAALSGEPTEAMQRKIYRQGYKAAASRMLTALQDARRAIDLAQRPGFDLYVEASTVERPVARPVPVAEPDVVPGSEEDLILKEAHA